MSCFMLYIDEAHAQDRWPVRSGRFMPGNEPVCVDAPRTMAERAALARRYHSLFHWPLKKDNILLDNLANTIGERFAAWPARFYLFQHRRLIVASEPEGADVGLASFLYRARSVLRGHS